MSSLPTKPVKFQEFCLWKNTKVKFEFSFRAIKSLHITWIRLNSQNLHKTQISRNNERRYQGVKTNHSPAASLAVSGCKQSAQQQDFQRILHFCSKVFHPKGVMNTRHQRICDNNVSYVLEYVDYIWSTKSNKHQTINQQINWKQSNQKPRNKIILNRCCHGDAAIDTS